MPTGPGLDVFWKGMEFRLLPKRLGVGSLFLELHSGDCMSN